MILEAVKFSVVVFWGVGFLIPIFFKQKDLSHETFIMRHSLEMNLNSHIVSLVSMC